MNADERINYLVTILKISWHKSKCLHATVVPIQFVVVVNLHRAFGLNVTPQCLRIMEKTR